MITLEGDKPMMNIIGVLVGAALVVVGAEFTGAVLNLRREDSFGVRVVGGLLCAYGACIACGGALMMWVSANA